MVGTLAVLAAFAFVYGVVAGRLERTPVNGPVVFLAFGILAGPGVLGLLDLNVSGGVLRTVAELTLAMVLFTDSANADLATLRRSFRIPQRLLLVGLPLTIAFGFGVGWKVDVSHSTPEEAELVLVVKQVCEPRAFS